MSQRKITIFHFIFYILSLFNLTRMNKTPEFPIKNERNSWPPKCNTFLENSETLNILKDAWNFFLGGSLDQKRFQIKISKIMRLWNVFHGCLNFGLRELKVFPSSIL